MIAFFIYLFKVSCWVAICWSVYYFFFRKETFYTFNRFYLITGLALSFIIPLIKIYYPVEIFITWTSTENIPDNISSPANPINIYSILFYIYICFILLFTIHQLFLLFKINSLIRSTGFTIIDNYRMVNSPKAKIPFSFYKYIFCNLQQISEDEKELIIVHERSHIIQSHWVDLVITECICIFLWFNPFIWLYLRSIKENHEYLADKAVIHNGYSPVHYRVTLINQSFNTPIFPLVISFAYYKFKRISMMKKETSNPLKKLAVILLIPATGFFLWAFSEPEYHFTTIEIPQQIEDIYLPTNDSIIVESAKKDQSAKKQVKVVYLKDTLKVSDIITISDEIVVEEDIESIQEVQDPVIVVGAGRINSPLYFIDGVESSTSDFKRLSPSDIESITILKEKSAGLYGEKAKNGVVLVSTKRTILPKFFSSDKDQNQVVVRGFGRNIPPVIDISQNKMIILNLNQDSPLCFIDGVEFPFSELKDYNPNQIESVSVLKNDSAEKLYNEKAKNGVILIKTKKANGSNSEPEIDINM